MFDAPHDVTYTAETFVETLTLSFEAFYSALEEFFDGSEKENSINDISKARNGKQRRLDLKSFVEKAKNLNCNSDFSSKVEDQGSKSLHDKLQIRVKAVSNCETFFGKYPSKKFTLLQKAYMVTISNYLTHLKRYFEYEDTLDVTESKQSMNFFIVSPSNPLRLILSFCVLWSIFYYVTYIPIRIEDGVRCYRMKNVSKTLSECLSQTSAWFAFDYAADFIFFTEFILRCTSLSFYSYDGKLKVIEQDRYRIFMKFLNSHQVITGGVRFLIYCVVLFPIDLFATSSGYLKLFRLTKLLSVFLFNVVLDDLLTYLAFETEMIVWNDAMILAGKLFFVTYVAMIWVSVIWDSLMTSYRNGTGAKSMNFESSWFSDSLFYTVTTLSTCGFTLQQPANVNETIYSAFLCLYGPCVFAVAIAAISSLFANEVRQAKL